jgi:hypothetical protein
VHLSSGTTAIITAHLSFKLRAALDIENFFHTNVGTKAASGHTETVFAHQFERAPPVITDELPVAIFKTPRAPILASGSARLHQRRQNRVFSSSL